MNKWFFLLSAAFLVAVALVTRSGSSLTFHGYGQTILAEVAKSGHKTLARARDLLEALDSAERKRALFRFDDKERFDWHFIPRTRPGVALCELGPQKQQKVTDLLEASLSAKGFHKAQEVRSLEAILREIEGPHRRFARDPLLYHVSFFGEPSAGRRWAWRFEGHHLCLNFVLDGERLVAATPAFFGANPATVRSGPQRGLRVLAAVEDLARSLVESLNESQLRSCLGKESSVPREVPEVKKPLYHGVLPAGITGGRLRPEQRDMLRRLLAEYRSHLSEDLALSPQDDMESVHFAWGGSLEPSQGHSYLIHGANFIINYSNYQNGANHIHSCLRDLQNDFGLGR